MNQKGTSKLILHLHQLHLKAELQPFNLKFVIYQGENNTQTKLESRKEIVLTNNKAYIEEAFEITCTKDGKILMIILKTKGKETSFLGQISIDTNRYTQQNLETINLQSAISKCAQQDDNSRLLLTLTFPKKQPLRQFELQRVLNKQYGNKGIKTSIITSTDSIVSKNQSESTVKAQRSRKISSDFYKKNYKNVEILRQDKKDKDSKSNQRSGSYKKRFQYQAQTTNKGKNTIVFMKQKKDKKQKMMQKQEIPRARDKTPQPIKLDRLTHSSHSKTKVSSKNSFSRPRQTTQRSSEKNQKLLISIHAKTERYETQSQANINQVQHTFSKASSNYSFAEEDKYSNLIDKLKFIDTKIQDKKSLQRSQKSQKQKSKEQQQINRDSVCTFGDAVKTSNEQNPTVSHLKIIQLEQKIIKLQENILYLEKQNMSKDSLIQKLSINYEKIVEQIESSKELYQKQIDSLQQQLIKSQKIKRTSTPDQNQLKNQKRKVLNLENTLVLKDNQIKHFKLSLNLLQEQRKQLQTMLAKKECKMGQNSSRALLEAEMMASGYPSAIKSQNELLRSENKLLKTYVQQLNELVEQYQLQNSRAVNHIKQKQVSDLKTMVDVLNKNIKVQQKIAEKLETQLRRTKLNFAVIMNVMFQKGGQELVELVQKEITQRNSGYCSDSQ